MPSLPGSVPQAHRWQLLRLHLNGIYTSARVAAAGVVQAASPCPYCSHGEDSAGHLVACPTVFNAWTQLHAHLAGALPGFDMPALYFQTSADGDLRSLLIAFFCAVLNIRRQLLASAGPVSPDIASRQILRVLDCPWVASALPTLTRRERRDARVRPPLTSPGSTVHRSDGVAMQGDAWVSQKVGWGAAMWSRDGVLVERACGRLAGTISKNVAKYHGLLAVFEKTFARRAFDKSIVFEVSSKLIERQVRKYGLGKYACRSPALQPLYLRCIDIGRALVGAGVVWEIRFIYSEFNQTAEGLARNGAVLGDSGWEGLPMP